MESPFSTDQMIDYLTSFDTFKHDPAEGLNYARTAIRRFMHTIDLIPESPEGGRLLELGSNPYFITLMIKKKFNYDLTLANYFGGDRPAHEINTLFSEKYGERQVFEFDHFNVEKDAFPYGDGSFDVVLCCEILEHLLENPTHMLCEIHRVLKRGGCLILTTPNVKSMANTLKLLFGLNVYGKYSGYGPYGRHNREYLPSEVRNLLEACGFTDIRVHVKDIYPRKWSIFNALPYFKGRQDNIFAVARSAGNIGHHYPDFLYQSMPDLINKD